MKLEEIVAKGYRLPFKPNKNVKRCPAPTHKKFGLDNCIDWGMPIGTPILASKGGIIFETESRFNTYGDERDKCHDKCNYVIIDHDNNEWSVYAHLKWRGVKVKKRQRVKAGQLIGYSGRTGFATYPHLHFGVYKRINNKDVNIKVKF